MWRPLLESTATPHTIRNLWKFVSSDKSVIVNDKAMFLFRSSELIHEGYTVHECFKLLLPHHCKNSLLQIRIVEEVFREGGSVSEVLKVLGFPDRILLSVKFSENDGRLSEALRGASIRLEAAELRKQKFIQAATYPVVLMVAMTLLLIAFKMYFLPNFETLAASRSATTSGIEKYLPRLVARTPDILLVFIGVVTCTLIIWKLHSRKLSAKEKIKKVTNIPFIGTVYKDSLTRLFASETGNLLTAGNSIQETMVILSSQTIDPIVAQVADTIHHHVAHGEPFHMSIELTDGLTHELSFFAKHGADSGHLPKELLLYSEQLGNKIDRKVTRVVSMLQPVLFVILAICIIAAYLALLLPVYGMIKNM